MNQKRMTQLLLGLGLLALVAVVGALWQRRHPQPEPQVQAAPSKIELTGSGLVAAADAHRKVLREAREIPPFFEQALTQLQGGQAPGAQEVEANPEQKPEPALADVRQSQQVLIGFSGGEIGETDNCGCAHNPLGGLARKVQWLRQATEGRKNTLILETGGLLVTAVPRQQEREGEALARADVFLHAMAKAGYAGLNVGAHELAFGLADLRRVAKARGIPLLSANIFDQKGQPAFTRKLVKQVGPLKIGVFGLISNQPPDFGHIVTEQGLQLQPATQTAQLLVQELRAEGCDVVILLSQLTRVEVDGLMGQVKGIDLVLGSNAMDLTQQLVTSGEGYFADTYTKGKYVGLITISARGKGRLFAQNEKGALTAQRQELAAQVQGLQGQLDAANDPQSPVKMSAEAREMVDHQIAALRARLQRVTLEIDSVGLPPPNANTVDLHLEPLLDELPNDPEVLKWIDKMKEKYPKIGGH